MGATDPKKAAPGKKKNHLPHDLRHSSSAHWAPTAPDALRTPAFDRYFFSPAWNYLIRDLSNHPACTIALANISFFPCVQIGVAFSLDSPARRLPCFVALSSPHFPPPPPHPPPTVRARCAPFLASKCRSQASRSYPPGFLPPKILPPIPVTLVRTGIIPPRPRPWARNVGVRPPLLINPLGHRAGPLSSPGCTVTTTAQGRVPLQTPPILYWLSTRTYPKLSSNPRPNESYSAYKSWSRTVARNARRISDRLFRRELGHRSS